MSEDSKFAHRCDLTLKEHEGVIMITGIVIYK